jgi:hypothetical protein
MDLSIFSPGVGEPPKPAKAICASCPVQAECLAEADEYGIWGGLSEYDRRRLGFTYKPRPVHAEHGRRPPRPHCPQGHPLKDDNLLVETKTGKRRCRQCRNAATSRYKRRRREQMRKAS